MNNKILLINPPYGEMFSRLKGVEWIAPPLGLCYLAAVIKSQGWNIKIIDMGPQQVNLQRLNAIIKEYKPAIIGAGAATPTIGSVYKIMETTKNINSQILTIVGGVHPSTLPDEVIQNEYIDVVIRGEGEIIIDEVIQKFERAGKNEIKGVRGTTQKGNGTILTNPSQDLIRDLDTIPFPARELLNLKLYRHPLSRNRCSTTLLTSRGCPYQCIYCSHAVFGNKYRVRSSENVLNEIEYLIKDYRIREIQIIDDVFSLDVTRLKDICNKIIEKDLDMIWSLPNGIRVDAIDYDTISLMKQAGCYSISFGIESGNEETLKYIKKNISMSSIRRAFSLAKRAGMETVAFIIIGLPNEGKKEINKTIKLMREIKADVVDFHTLIPLPGTEVYNELKKKGNILESDWSKYTFHDKPVFKTECLSREEIGREYIRAYRSYFLHPSYIFSRIFNVHFFRDLSKNLKGLMAIIRNFLFHGR